MPFTVRQRHRNENKIPHIIFFLFIFSSFYFTWTALLAVSKQKLLRCRRRQRRRCSLTDAMHGIGGVLNNFDWIHSTNFIDRCDNNSTVHMLCWKLHRFSILFLTLSPSSHYHLIEFHRGKCTLYIHPRARARKIKKREAKWKRSCKF